jgi:hypothetical protein
MPERSSFHTTLSLTFPAAGDYAAADVMSEATSSASALAFTGMAPRPGLGGVITQAIITMSVEALVPRLRLHLFDQNPTGCELRDNVARSLVIADRSKKIGQIDFPALADVGTYSEAYTDGLAVSFTTPESANTIWGILETLDAFTNESASMTGTIELLGFRD